MSVVEQPDHHDKHNSFNENSPRPPVPVKHRPQPPVIGKETDVSELLENQSPIPTSSSGFKFKGGSSPVLTPRRSSLACQNVSGDFAPLGFEPEGRCSNGDGSGSSLEMEHGTPPSYLCWARDLHSLLDDSHGVKLFQTYLQQEDSSQADMLTFLFACRGLKQKQQHEPSSVSQIIKAIYRRFFHKTKLSIPAELRAEVNRKIREGKDLLCGDIFDNVQIEVERRINETSYPNFLRSDMYLQHIQTMQNSELSISSPSGSGGSSGSSSGGRDVPGPGAGGSFLPTVHEDSELASSSCYPPVDITTQQSHEPSSLPLTRDMLIATQKKRAFGLRPKPEAFAGMYLQHAHYPYLPHHSYVPNSRQDSELQSLSSDARSESDRSTAPLSDRSTDGAHSKHPKKHPLSSHPSTKVKEGVVIHRERELFHIIPRTTRIQLSQSSYEEFAARLIQKLEVVKKEQELEEKLKKLQDSNQTCDEGNSENTAKTFADALREKLQEEEVSNQAILDEHVLRVWSDLTPSRSPGFSPRPKSPEARRRVTAPSLGYKGSCSDTISALLSPSSVIPSHFGSANLPQHHQSHFRPSHLNRYPRKDKDVYSNFSSDSGNFHDFPEDSEHRYHSGYSIPKSKSMPDYQEPDSYSPTSAHDPKCRQSKDIARKSINKKISAELTDSGVSVVSSGTSVPSPSTQYKGKHSRKVVPYNGSRSESLERNAAGSSVQWVGASSLQPDILSPSSAIADTRRRQEEESRSKIVRQRQSTSGKVLPVHTTTEAPFSSHSTIRKSSRGPRSSLPAYVSCDNADYTTVVFSFCDEQFPYRVKIPGRPVTLRQFKEFLPKKGSYRYFFKTECEDVDIKVIQEEVTEDDEILPLWEGKIMAQVKSVE